MSSINPLEQWRLDKNISVIDLCERLEVSRGHMYALLAGKNLPQPGQATRIQAKTGVTRSQLLAWQESQSAVQSDEGVS
jgi:transcriptional regulator with XRE-family HTH domain